MAVLVVLVLVAQNTDYKARLLCGMTLEKNHRHGIQTNVQNKRNNSSVINPVSY